MPVFDKLKSHLEFEVFGRDTDGQGGRERQVRISFGAWADGGRAGGSEICVSLLCWHLMAFPAVGGGVGSVLGDGDLGVERCEVPRM